MVYTTGSWDLSDLDSKDVKKVCAEIDGKVKLLEGQRILLVDTISVKDFLEFTRNYEELTRITERLGVFCHLQFAENTQNQQALALQSKVNTFLTEIGNRLLFFSHWFKGLSEAKAQELIKASGKYHYYFERLRDFKPHTLLENEEKIINIKDANGVSALNTIYDVLTSKLVFHHRGKSLTQEELLSLVRGSQASVRKEAYVELLSKYKEHKEVIGEIYKNVVNDWRSENMGLRHYPSPISVRNKANDLPDEAVSVLLRVCEKNEKLFQRFFKIKQRKLKLKTFRRFDLYAPLKSEKVNISYDKAVQLVLSSMQSFHPRFKEHAQQIIDKKHVHSQIVKGKQSGAFCCMATTQLPPYVLLSYKGDTRSISTLAHELGHGVHAMLATHQSEFTNHAPLPLAETASIFSEMILSENLLKENPKQAQELMFSKLEDVYASIIRQAGFIRFELKAHKLIEEGKTIDEMSAVYLADLKKQLGPGVVVDPLYAYEWCYVSHIFHTPFYCYAYAFGNLLTLALYEMYRQEGRPFADKVVAFLAKGGSERPIEIAKVVGADITSEAFWQKGFDVVKRMIDEVDM